jgi:Ca2+-binding EF-hand superfamily protein
MDVDMNGTISLSELRDALREKKSSSSSSSSSSLDAADGSSNREKRKSSSLSDEQIDTLFAGLDHDHSGQIHYVEFLAAVVESQGLITEEHLAEAFDRLDSDNSGYISAENLKSLLGTDYNKALVEKMIQEVDVKKTGFIDYEEFLDIFIQDVPHEKKGDVVDLSSIALTLPSEVGGGGGKEKEGRSSASALVVVSQSGESI